MIARVWRSVWREGLGFVAGTAFGLQVGMEVTSGLVLGVAVAAAVVLGTRLRQDADPSGERERHVRPDGARGDLQDLAWSMTGRDGRAGERALRRLREVAAVRLARHGVDLGDAAQADAVRALVGARAAATLGPPPTPSPSVADLAHTLGVLEALGTHPAAATEIARPDAARPATARPATARPRRRR